MSKRHHEDQGTDHTGQGESCGAKVVQVKLRQWKVYFTTPNLPRHDYLPGEQVYKQSKLPR